MKKLILPAATLEKLAAAEAWTAYTALRGLAPLGATLEAARRASVESPLVQSLVRELGSWPGEALASHKSASQLFHRLAFAAELGLRRGDRAADSIARAVMSRRSQEGPFALPLDISAAHGGSGEETLGWALCDAPVILRALVRMGYGDEKPLRAAVAYLVSLSLGSGWPCAVSKSLGSFRGPGKKSDPCPYATLVMLELLLELEEYRDCPAVLAAAGRLLELWERSREEHPYIFYMGDDFRKLKAPLIWYDILHVLEALTKVSGIQGDRRLRQMLDTLEAKAGTAAAGTELLFTPESVYLAWKGYDFGQKKAPSLYLSSLALGIFARSGRLELQP